VLPEASAAAWANRGFHQRAARWMARQGIGQFIDLGCGLPTTASTAATVRKINPSARVLYADHDPAVAAHARALLTSTGTTSVILAEVRDLVNYLSQQRAHVLGILENLPEDAMRRSVLPTGWTCAGLVQHLALDVERFWFRQVMTGEQVEPGPAYSAARYLTSAPS
jgi:hypothetical protein